MDLKHIYDFDMTPTTEIAIYLAIFAVCVFACALAMKLYMENQKKITAKNTTSALSAEKNIGDGI
ncbi:MAG: hypothetical protein P4L53_25145 [Candidatus Obscuribacterales bacterium]|nr:hypothetical protein [Candidatus Obscuribacterales bacterium]